MARFFVGQKIKKVSGSTNIGLTATVVNPYEESTPVTDKRNTLVVYPDSTPDLKGGVIYDNKKPIYTCPDDWSPITDCYDLSTWDQCVWRPEHMRTEA